MIQKDEVLVQGYGYCNLQWFGIRNESNDVWKFARNREEVVVVVMLFSLIARDGGFSLRVRTLNGTSRDEIVARVRWAGS